jgi:glycosyltransferase involved in cell wall biosynthesis
MIYINARFLTQDITGVQRFSYEICKELIKKRNDIKFLVPSKRDVKNLNELKDFEIIEVKGFHGHLWEQLSLPVYLKMKGGNNLLLNLCNTAPVLYSNQICTHHDITYVRYPESFSKKFSFFYKFISRFFLKKAKSIITVSDFSKKEICDYYKIQQKDVTVVYNAIGYGFKKNESSSEKTDEYILAVSSPSYHKNFHGLIAAFKDSNLEIKLKIIGGINNSFSDKYNLDVSDDRIEILGRVSDSELVKLYSNATAFIFPSLYEGLEYLL